MLFFYLFVIFNKSVTSIKLLFLVKSYIFIYAKRSGNQFILRVSPSGHSDGILVLY